MRRRLRVVSWNVGRVYSPTHNNRLDDGDLPRVARVLGELDGDVVLLQEVVSLAQLDDIRARLRHDGRGEFHGAIAQFCVYDRRVAAVARRELAPAFEEFAIGTTGRSALVASVELGGDRSSGDRSSGDRSSGDRSSGDGRGRRIERAAAIATHLDVLSPERRADQGHALAALAESRAEPLVVVGGDLNLDPAVAAASGSRRDLATFARLTETLSDAARDAGPTLLGLLRVDHMLLRGARSWLARVSPRRLPLGDHHPLVLDVDLDNA
jgi:endonuclease/exonuclease/phosphatase family metal-dependent hydrolase